METSIGTAFPASIRGCLASFRTISLSSDISGISGVVSNEVSKADEDIADANRQISMASQEKAQLETEAV